MEILFMREKMPSHYYELTNEEIVSLAFSFEFSQDYHCFLDAEHGLDWAALTFGKYRDRSLHVTLAREFFHDLGTQQIYPENWGY